MSNHTHQNKRTAWGNFRFGVIGGLLSSPPPTGSLKGELVKLSERTWKHPIHGGPVQFAFPTIEQWYYQAKASNQPAVKLQRKIRGDSGRFRILPSAQRKVIRELHSEHPEWTHQLHYDNLVIVAKQKNLGRVPSYATIRRYRNYRGFVPIRLPKNGDRSGVAKALARLESREVRSYESSHVLGLIHSDFHVCSRKILNEKGEWVKPRLVAFMDDRSRLICHAQWYWRETTENFVHGLLQAFLKRGLPRALMTDNGKAMTAGETTSGLQRLSIIHELTLPYSPYQNGKQESFWGKVEGRLLPMLEGEENLTLKLLNDATIAWIEMEYHRKIHSETKQTPIERFLDGPFVDRKSPTLTELKQQFTVEENRSLRRSDCTISLGGRRYEVPSRFRHLKQVTIRYASWNLASVMIVNRETGHTICPIYPLDSEKNAQGQRRTMVAASNPKPRRNSGIAPLLKEQMRMLEERGNPAAYLPKDERGK